MLIAVILRHEARHSGRFTSMDTYQTDRYNSSTVKVLDFGLAKAVAGDVPDVDLSQSQTWMELPFLR